jgi:alkanesulfonate monooxygenase SsuD/methylene tetrahydromethanopterin reductase-like flavin-dependent oxidoreductase (luciferase family)
MSDRPQAREEGHLEVSDVLIGVTLPQFTDDSERFVDGALRAEAAGLDSMWVFDHLWPLSGGKGRPIIEAWTALAYAAQLTTRIRIGTLVTRSSLRHPTVLAKMAATVASVAPDRLIVAVGSGDVASRPENEAYGIDYFGNDNRSAQLASTVGVVRSYLRDDSVSQADGFASVANLPSSPALPASPPVWVAGRSDEVLSVAGRLADGWNGWGGAPDEFARDAETVVRAAGGRPIELTWGGLVVLGDTDGAARDKLGSRSPEEWVVGGPGAVAAHLSAIVEAGARHLICTFSDAGRPGAYELLAETVRPGL